MEYKKRKLSFDQIIAEAEVYNKSDVSQLQAVIDRLNELKNDHNVRKVKLMYASEMSILYESPKTQEEIEMEKKASKMVEQVYISQLQNLIDRYPEFALTYIQNKEFNHEK